MSVVTVGTVIEEGTVVIELTGITVVTEAIAGRTFDEISFR